MRELRLRGPPFLSSAEPELLPIPAPPARNRSSDERENEAGSQKYSTRGGGRVVRAICTYAGDDTYCYGSSRRTLEHAAAHSPLEPLLYLFPRGISPFVIALRTPLMLALDWGITTRSYARLATSPREV